MKILVGCDPELFVIGPDGKPVSAYGMSKGTKAKPEKVAKGAVQVDGMALEFNIDPASSGEEFSNNIDIVLREMITFIPGNHTLDARPVAEFSAEYMKTRCAAEVELGCDPDYNAYTGEPNPRPNGKVNFRTGSGHIHIGWTEGMDPMDPDHFEACRMITRELDYTLGYVSMIWDQDAKRRKLYGAAGAFRPKPYGVEYRTLSNAWVTNEKLRKFIFDIVQKTCNNLEKGKSFFAMYGGDAQRAIANNASNAYNSNYFLQEIGASIYAEGGNYVWQ